MTEPTFHRILLADDEPALREALTELLTQEGYEVCAVSDGKAALAAAERFHPDVAILDVLMPELDGLAACKALRARSRLPIVLLTSRGEEMDKVLGLDFGADDYLTKPFSNRELCARLRALARRTLAAAPGAASPWLRRGPLELSSERFEARYAGAQVELTKLEFRLVQALATRPGRVLSREQLLTAVHDEQVAVTDRTIDALVKRVRARFRGVDDSFDGIETLVGVGYRWRDAGR